MTRDGAISVNLVTGEATHVSDRPPEQDYSSADETAGVLNRAADEAVGVEAYDYILINEDVERSTELLHKVIQIQHMRVSQKLPFIYEINKELRTLE